jgi:hypothetical protein
MGIDMRLARTRWQHTGDEGGGRKTFAGAACARLEDCGFDLPEPGTPERRTLNQLLQNVRRGTSKTPTASTHAQFVDCCEDPKLLLAAACLVASMVNKTEVWEKKVWNPSVYWDCRERIAPEETEADKLAVAAHTKAVSSKLSDPEAQNHVRERRDKLRAQKREEMSTALSELTSFAEVVKELEKDDEPTDLALAIGREVGREVWQHTLDMASLRAVHESFRGSSFRGGEAGDALRAALKGGEELTAWKASAARKNTTLSRKNTAPMVAAIFCAMRGIGGAVRIVKLRKVRAEALQILFFGSNCAARLDAR